MTTTEVIWEHYKGGLYNVLHRATHTETGEELVVYQNLLGSQVWVRPATMFDGLVKLENGDKVKRFQPYLPF